ncbi:hypothetical protein NEOLEDRAFT_129590 [Neolentinus lepideus HHB14362 ss-1]|uniref:Uncharacterized protein n=1 Tax=Neolentinus lepideus HHB14362 ss-1 TaxID=1314782 RepID=A0A165MQ07_9AGAM|nr:hypothetical protein NEOLEDRAFT_129590 [Neolentinus lepideus HHB14362 ss-1]
MMVMTTRKLTWRLMKHLCLYPVNQRKKVMMAKSTWTSTMQIIANASRSGILSQISPPPTFQHQRLPSLRLLLSYRSYSQSIMAVETSQQATACDSDLSIDEQANGKYMDNGIPTHGSLEPRHAACGRKQWPDLAYTDPLFSIFLCCAVSSCILRCV